MILCASRRTDIPALYSDWFLNRIRAGYVYVPNPMNARQISRVPLSPEVVDCIVFWSKNPAPLLPRLAELEKYPCYFQYTLNAYEWDLERNLPPIAERIDTFRARTGAPTAMQITMRIWPRKITPLTTRTRRC